MTAPIAFTVLGAPEPKGSTKAFPLFFKDADGEYEFDARTGKPRVRILITSDNPEVKRWQETVADAARRALNGRECDLFGAFAIEAVYYFSVPESYRKTFNGRHVVRPDGDKCLRAICDALKGVLFHDDAQITDHISRKRYAEPGTSPRVEIVVTPLVDALPLFPEAHTTGRPRTSRPVAAATPSRRTEVPW